MPKFAKLFLFGHMATIRTFFEIFFLTTFNKSEKIPLPLYFFRTILECLEKTLSWILLFNLIEIIPTFATNLDDSKAP